jgi:ferredoxin-NADP reductase
MSDYVEVPFEGKAEEKATLLLAAAEESENHSAADVRTISGGFLVPKELADKAGVEGQERGRPDLALREAEIPEGLVDTYKMGPGPTGEVETNAGENAEQGTVQNDKGEQKMNEPARDNVQNDGEQKKSRRKTRKSAEANDKSESQDKE